MRWNACYFKVTKDALHGSECTDSAPRNGTAIDNRLFQDPRNETSKQAQRLSLCQWALSKWIMAAHVLYAFRDPRSDNNNLAFLSKSSWPFLLDIAWCKFQKAFGFPQVRTFFINIAFLKILWGKIYILI